MKDILCVVKKDIEIQPCQDLNLGLLNASQLLLQAERLHGALALWHLSKARQSSILRLDFSQAGFFLGMVYNSASSGCCSKNQKY